MFYTSVEFADMQQKSIIWKEDQDCCVKAMAIALDIPYAKAWYTCRKFGRPFQDGMHFEDFLKAFESLNYKVVLSQYTGKWHDFQRDCRDGTYIINSETIFPQKPQGHVHVYKDGIMHDQAANWIGVAVACYEVIHKDDYISPLVISESGTSGTITYSMG